VGESAETAGDISCTAAELAYRVNQFSSFYREFVPTLVGFLISLGATVPEATDIAQETMTRAYQRWGSIKHPPAWAHQVAAHEYARGSSNNRAGSGPEPVEANSLLRLDTDALAFEERHEVVRLLQLLPPRQRQVLAWTFDGYTPKEIARELQLTPEAVRASLLKARRALVTHLTRSGPDA
jgi:RNA polymerase sigma-70 factor (ECF subfamily)